MKKEVIVIKEKKLKILMQHAEVAAQGSHDSETKVGSVLITQDGAIIATGTNGFISGAPDHKLPNTRPEKYPYIVHSEMNLIAHCARLGISTNNCALVCTMSPCVSCMRLLFQSGIKEVVFKTAYRDFEDVRKMADIDIFVTKISNYTVLHYVAADDEYCDNLRGVNE